MAEEQLLGCDAVKGHDYRIVVRDLQRRRPFWFGGKERKVVSVDGFYAFLGEKMTKRMRLAVMDMWPAVYSSTRKHAPQGAILYDQFHIIRHLGEALDEVSKHEYGRLRDKHRKFVKGQKYTLLPHMGNLRGTARRNLKHLLSANKQLNTAYVLKESLGQLWECRREAWARKFFENWPRQLKSRRLKPYEKLPVGIDRYWSRIAAYCKPEHKNVALDFVERLNNKIRVPQRRAYGLRDEEYLRLKLLTCTLPKHY